MPIGNWRTRLLTVSMSTCLERAPLMGQAITAGAIDVFTFTEQQSDIHVASSLPTSSHLPTSSSIGGLLRLRWIARIRSGFHERIRVGFCIVEGHQNLFLFKPHIHLGNAGNLFERFLYRDRT